MSLDPIIWASLSWKPYEALHRVGLVGFYRRHVTNEYTWVRKQFCRPPTSTYWWMTKWWNDERIWTLRLYISRWTLAEVLRPIIYQKHLPDPFNCFCCWKFMKVLFRCLLNILNLKVLQKRWLNLLGSRGAGCALVFRRLDCSGCVQFCALNLPGWSCLTWQEIDIWTMDYIYKSMLKTILNGYWINLNTNSAWVKVKHKFSITFLWSYQSVSSIASLKSSKIVKSQPSSSLRHAVSACRPCCPLRFGRLLPRFDGFEGPGVSRESDQSWILQWIEEQRFHHGVQQEGRVFTDASAGCLLLRPCTQGWVGGLWKTSRRQISGQWELQTTSELQEIGSSDYQGRIDRKSVV